MLNFNDFPENTFRSYNGANGKKKCLMINNEPYMVKIMNTDVRSDVRPMGAISEYLGSHIYNILSIPAQETCLGTYTLPQNGSQYLAVGCKDFCSIGERLCHFDEIRNTIVSSSKDGKNHELIPILISLEEQNRIPVSQMKERFWDMVVVDALIGNFDRHTGNFGIISNEMQQTSRLAPVYDCGSALYPAPSDEQVRNILLDENEQLTRVYEYPASSYRDHLGNKVKYLDLLTNEDFPDCIMALRRIYPIIQEAMPKIHQLISSLAEEKIVSEERLMFYDTMIDLRKERLLDYAYEKTVNIVLSKESVPYKEIAHQREYNLQKEPAEFSGSQNAYVELYQYITQLQNEKILQKHIRDTDIDAMIVSVLRKEHQYSAKDIAATCEALSPAAVGRENYSSRILVKAKDENFSSLTRATLKKYQKNQFVR